MSTMKMSTMTGKASIDKPWLQNYGHIPYSLEYPDISMWELVADSVKKYPDYVAYNYFGKTATYTEMMKQIETCARAYKALGIKSGDKVTICMPNTPEAVISFYALNMIGAVANMIHPLSAENEIKRFLNITDSRLIIAIDICAGKIKNIIAETIIEKAIIVSPKDPMPHPQFISFREFLSYSNKYDGEYKQKANGSAIAAIMYSGGTTGDAKGILLTNFNFNVLAVQSMTWADCFEAQDRILSVTPIFHGYGLATCIHAAFWVGMTTILLPQFDVSEFHKLLSEYKPHALIGVPALYEALLRNKHIQSMDLSFLKLAASGGDSLSVHRKQKVDAFLKERGANVEVRDGYGMTESVTVSCWNPKHKTITGSIGIPFPDVTYKIVTPGTQEEVGYGEVGEICVSGPTVMVGYLDQPDETAKTLQKHDDNKIWLHTGDLGYIEEDGYVYFKQRINRIIISSGYNIYPQNIENIIDSHPDVMFSAIIGVPDEFRGKRVKAYIVLKNEITATKEVRNSIRDHCKKNIAKYAIPKEFEYRDTLPKTIMGKVDYRALERENANQ